MKSKKNVYATNSIAPIVSPKGKREREIRATVKRSDTDLRAKRK